MAVFDAIGERVVLVTMLPYDQVNAVTVTVRVADRDVVTLPTDTPALATFDGYLLALPVEQHLVAPGRVRGASVGMKGSARIANPSRDDGVAGRKLDLWRGYAWQGSKWFLELWDPSTPFSARVQIFAGEVA